MSRADDTPRSRRACAVLLCLAAVPLLAADWPQFRGPDRDGVSAETGLASEWPKDGPPQLWRVDLGQGYSSIAVVGGRLFTMFAKGGDEFAVALDAATGKEIWRVRTDAEFKDMFGDGPRATPTVQAGKVFVLGARGKLYALAAEDGKQIWMHDLVEEYGAKPPQWGYAGSPLVEGKDLLVDVGGKRGSSLVAFDTKAGYEAWRSQEDTTGYSAPIAVTVAGKRHALFFTGTSLVSVAPEDGTLRWRLPWKTSYGVNAATPIFIPPDKVFVSSGYDVGAAVFRIADVSAEEVWRNRDMKNKFSSSVLHDGFLYGFDEKIFKCIDAATGATRWQSRGFGHGSLILADGRLYVLGDEGALALVDATPEEFRERSRFELLHGKTWTSPALSGGKLYVRNEKVLVAIDVSD